MVRVSHILMATRDDKTNAELSEEQKAAKRKKADDLLKRAKAGEDFTKLANEFSEDPGVKQNHGEYKFSRDDAFVPEFKAAAFALSVNQVSDIVTTQFGYHILKLSEKIPAKKLELDKVMSDVKVGLTNQAVQTQFPAFIDKLKKDADVAILDEKLKPKETPAASGLPSGHPAISPDTKPKGK
jgi:parvulin-like peptidyl-prolyl isomerase